MASIFYAMILFKHFINPIRNLDVNYYHYCLDEIIQNYSYIIR